MGCVYSVEVHAKKWLPTNEMIDIHGWTDDQ